MNLFFKLTPVLTVLAMTVACGDDEEGDGGDGTGDAECVGTYDGMTQAELEAEISSDGACADDAEAVCTNDVSGITGRFGASCFMTNSDDPEAWLDCTMDGVLGDVDPDPSDACMECYTDAVDCARVNCATICAGAPTSTECQDCRNDAGCTSAFFACSGLPVPGSM